MEDKAKEYYKNMDDIKNQLIYLYGEHEENDSLAKGLVGYDIKRIDDKMRERMDYLMSIAGGTFWESSSASVYVSVKMSLDEIKQQEKVFHKYSDNEIDISAFGPFLSEENISEYRQICEEYSFRKDEIKSILKTLVEMIWYICQPSAFRKRLEIIQSLGMTDEEFKQYVVFSCYYILNDYIRHFEESVQYLVKDCGSKEKAFLFMREHKDCIYNISMINAWR